MEYVTTPPDFFPWLRESGLTFLLVVVGLAKISILFGYLVTAVRRGPVAALSITSKAIAGGVVDLVRISPRRVMALAWLAIKESIGRRVLVVFVIYALVLMFAGLILDPTLRETGRLYVGFVLNAMLYLMLALAWILSAFSLPNDLKQRTIYTIVTKPVRPSEIVLGRMIGFSAVGSMLLAVMALFSFLFVVRSLRHTHAVEAGSQTSLVTGHRHVIDKNQVGEEGGTTDRAHSHSHHVDDPSRGEMTGPSQGELIARVPIHGTLQFTDDKGQPKEKGTNVGKEWTYRSYIKGGSLAAATWRFSDVRAEDFCDAEGKTDSLPITMNLRVFRLHKGTIDRGVLGSIVLRNPDDPDLVSGMITFRAKEFQLDEIDIPRHLLSGKPGPDGRPMRLDLFDDLVSESGELDVQIQCEESQQYFGMAQEDVYLRSRDGSFAMNFIKGCLGIWLQMVIVLSLGVMFSTFLSGPVTMIATLGALVTGMFAGKISALVAGEYLGGGPIEAFVRIVTQRNLVSPLEVGMATTLIEMFDKAILFILWVILKLLPDFQSYSNIDQVAIGFNIPGMLSLQHLLSALAYLSVAMVVGLFFLRTREVAR
jgi:ABC-type transport system involved in multi-copper enzyme maturation permease subunit